jgi:hypothetical protein
MRLSRIEFKFSLIILKSNDKLMIWLVKDVYKTDVNDWVRFKEKV